MVGGGGVVGVRVGVVEEVGIGLLSVIIVRICFPF